MSRLRSHGWVDPADDRRWSRNTGAGAALNDAIVRAEARRSKVVMPPGAYDIEQPIRYLSNVQVLGSGKGLTTLNYQTNGAMFINGTGDRQFRNKFADFTAVNSSGVAAVGLDWDSISAGELSDVSFDGFGIGVDFNSDSTVVANGAEAASLYNKTWGLDCRNGGDGVVLRHQSNSNWFYSPLLLLNDVGMRITKANQTAIHGGAMENNNDFGLLFDAPVPNFNRMNAVSGVRFERNGTHWNITNNNTIRTMFSGNFYDGGAPPWIDNSDTTMRFELPLGFWGKQGYIAKPTVTGSRGGNQALNVLLFTLDRYGLIDNGSLP